MQYRQVGKSGLRISAVSIGGWLTFGGSIEEDAAASVLKASLDAGINFIDLADIYAMGKAEEVAGRALRGLPRNELVISSKVFAKMSEDTNDRGLSRKHIFESVDRSLRRLQTDYLDIYFCHREDPDTPMEETCRAMDDLVRMGKIHYWGTSVWTPEGLREAHAIADKRNMVAPTVEQPQYSLLVRDVEHAVVPTCADLGMGIVAWSPLAGGALTGKYDDGCPAGSRGDQTNHLDRHLTEPGVAKLRAFSVLAREAGHAPSALALAWVLHNPVLSSVITGASNADQVKANVVASEIEITSDLAAQLNELFPVGEPSPV
jgi:voltage-dependent potassium channel beta subunit